jgi:short subunit dehydrogenase-like uncharacterized protein
VAERDFDLVLFGATGYTGGLTAQYLAEHMPEGARWALAGRNPGKLAAVRIRLAESHPELAELPLLTADVTDPASVRTVAERAEVMITTVGPYIRYGEPLVAACAAAGTDYVDLTGEPEFVDLMYLRHHEQAVQNGARIVHSCGFDSIPYDLGALWTVGQLPDEVPIALSGYARMGGTFSGGTFHSAIHAMGRLRQSQTVGRERAARERRDSEAPERRVRGVAGRPHRDPLVGGWVVPAPTIDPQTVLRSARALPDYGPDFSYSHYIVTGRIGTTLGLAGGVAGAVALAQLPLTRSLLLRLKSPGEGPTAEQRARGFFRVRLVAQTPTRRLVTEVRGGDPGYGETAKMLAQAGMSLAFDPLPETRGQVTPAVAMGHALIERLRGDGIAFEVVEDG